MNALVHNDEIKELEEQLRGYAIQRESRSFQNRVEDELMKKQIEVRAVHYLREKYGIMHW